LVVIEDIYNLIPFFTQYVLIVIWWSLWSLVLISLPFLWSIRSYSLLCYFSNLHGL
jgi:hypothetical protein